ncbi:MAG TPA: shikimate kinase, partial [Candidatus Limnocylindrales bacterium]
MRDLRDADPLHDVRHVVLLGTMGSGKTTVGRLLAERLGRPLRDSDPEIEAATGYTAREIRDRDGPDALHDLEARLLLSTLALA